MMFVRAWNAVAARFSDQFFQLYLNIGAYHFDQAAAFTAGQEGSLIRLSSCS